MFGIFKNGPTHNVVVGSCPNQLPPLFPIHTAKEHSKHGLARPVIWVPADLDTNPRMARWSSSLGQMKNTKKWGHATVINAEESYLFLQVKLGLRLAMANTNSPLLFLLLLVIATLQSRVPGCTRARVLGFSCPSSSTHQHTPAVMLHCSAKKAPSFGLHSGMNIPRSGCLQI